jgi:peptide/nickel transport system substrate-binding protein
MTFSKAGALFGVVALAAAAAAGAAFSSSSTVRAGAAARQIDTLTWGLTSGPRSLDLAHSMDINTLSVLSLGMESLLKIDQHGKIVPNLATSWTQPNKLTYVFNLRHGVKFWDGKPMTPADVVYSFNRHLDPKTQSQDASFFSNMKEAVESGPEQVTIHMKHPDPTFIYMPATYAFILEKAYALKEGKNLGTPSGGIMGTGAYTFSDFKPDDGITATRNENYWGPKPPIKTIVFKFIPEDSTRLLALRSGQIDGTFIVPLAQSQSWQRSGNVTVQYAPGMNQDQFAFNPAVKPFDDVHVRRAFAYALDRQGLVKSLLGGHGEVAVGQAGPAQWAGKLSVPQVRAFYDKIDGYPFSVAKARAELKKSKYPNGFTATIKFADGFPETGQIAENLAANLAKIGIKLNVVKETTDAFIPTLFSHKGYGITIAQSQPDYPDPWDYPAQYYASWNAINGGLDFASYKNPAMDKLILQEEALPTSSPTRVKLLEKAETMMRSDLAYLPVFYMDSAMAISKKYAFKNFDAIYASRDWAYNVEPQ